MATTVNMTAQVAWVESRDVRCLCGRFLTQTKAHRHLPAYTIWVRLKCQGCDHWRWVDTVSGEIADAPREPVLN